MALEHERDLCLKMAEETKQLGEHRVEEACCEGGNTLSCVFSVPFMALYGLVTSAAAMAEENQRLRT